MELFGVGIGEAGLVLLLALLVVGPQRFPQVAREGARWYRMARAFAADVTSDLQGALQELENEVKEQSGDLKAVREIGEDVRAGMRETSADVRAIGAGVGAAAAVGAAATSEASGSAAQAPESLSGSADGSGAADMAAATLEGTGAPGSVDSTPAPAAAGAVDPFELVRRSYAQYHTPPPPPAPPAPDVDPDEMSRQAMEAFESFRAADVTAAPVAAADGADDGVTEATAPASGALSPSLLTGVNPFGSPPPAAQVMLADPPTPEAASDGVEDTGAPGEAGRGEKRAVIGTTPARPAATPATDA